MSSILGKLGLADRTQAAPFALQHHLVPLDEALGPKSDLGGAKPRHR